MARPLWLAAALVTAATATPPAAGGTASSGATNLGQGWRAPVVATVPFGGEMPLLGTPRVLVFEDGSVGGCPGAASPPETHLDHALEDLGVAYSLKTAMPDFAASLYAECWDLVILSNQMGCPSTVVLDALQRFVQGGGRVVAESWAVSSDPLPCPGTAPNHPLWTALGFQFGTNRFDAPPLYWWADTDPVFTTPESVPEFTTPSDCLFIDGVQGSALPGAEALAGFVDGTPPPPDQAAMVRANEGRTMFLGYMTATVASSDNDSDGLNDEYELWTNLVSNLLVDGEDVCASAAELFVANDSNEVTVYSTQASGHASPIRRIAGGNTGLLSLRGIALDTVHSELFVADPVSAAVRIFALTADGDVAPLRTLQGPGTGLEAPYAVAVDPDLNEVYVGDRGVMGSPAIRVYARDGLDEPLRTLIGAQTGLTTPSFLFVDRVHDELLVAQAGTISSVVVYPRRANGSQPPLRTLIGGNTGLTAAHGIFVDLAAEELLVIDQNSSSVRVFARAATGNVPPLRVIAGDQTLLASPAGMVLIGAGGGAGPPKEIVATNQDNRVTVHAAAAVGNTPPLRSIGGDGTLLVQPLGVASTVATGGATGFVSPPDPAAIFRDGFESGGLEQWSAAVP